MAALLAAAIAACLLVGAPRASHAADPAVDAARALLAEWHLDAARIDRARDILESAARDAPSAETLIVLARTWRLSGEMRATSGDAKLAAYERGRDVARRAVERAPQSDAAHLAYASNLGRWAQARGIMRSLIELSSIRESLATALRLNPRNPSALVMAGSIAAQLPRLFGGDRAKAEAYFGDALAVDPRFTGARLERARFYIAMKRWDDARHDLMRILDETAPTDVPRWTVQEAPEARRLLESIRDR